MFGYYPPYTWCCPIVIYYYDEYDDTLIMSWSQCDILCKGAATVSTTVLV